MRDEAGRGSSMPYISAFSSEGAALMTLGTTRSPSATAETEAWRSRRTATARRRCVGMDEADVVVVVVVGEEALLDSVLRFLAMGGRATDRDGQEPSKQPGGVFSAAAVALALALGSGSQALAMVLTAGQRRMREQRHGTGAGSLLGHAGRGGLMDWRCWDGRECAGGFADAVRL